MSTWQRGGRVGRRQRESLVVLVGQEDALDQYFMRHPGDFFKREVEAAVLNPDNLEVGKRHLICAAAELPLGAACELLLSKSGQAAVAELNDSGDLLLTADGRFWCAARKYPHRQVDLRGSGRSLAIRDNRSDELLGQIDWQRSMQECHPGSVYLHRGRTWLVDRLDLEGGEVRATCRQVNYFTRPLAHKETEVLAVSAKLAGNGGDGRLPFQVAFGRLRVTDTVTGFQRRLVKGGKLLGTERLALPPAIFETEGVWLEIPAELQQRMAGEQRHFLGAIHAIEHALIGIFPLLVLCDRNDIGGIAYPYHPQIQGPAIFIYDGHPGGVGLCRQAFARFGDLLAAGLETIRTCACATGCPSCVHSPKCGSGNRPIDKAAARLLLSWLVGEELTCSRLPVAGGQEGTAPLVAAPTVAVAALRYGVFDVETRRSAAEVGGWHRAERMGISVLVLYDSGPDRFFVYRDDEIADFVSHLKELGLVVGFNNKRFDNLVLSAYTACDLGALPTLDILEEVKDRLGYRLSLDGLAEQTLGVKKTADGLQALQWYQEGRIDKIIEYCKKDVALTRDLFRYGVANGYLLFKNKAGSVVRCPVKFGG
jgi:DEAD/DEAH box helicase domain-containing protein